MADEEKNNETTEIPKEGAPKDDALAEEPKDEVSAEEPKDEAAEEAPSEESTDDAPAGEPEADAAEAPADARSDDDEMDWKARRRLERSRESGAAGPERSPEDRASERARARGEASKARSAYRRKRREGREKGEGTAPAERESAGRKERRGRVVSDKSDKTITVQINLARRHPTYEKIVRNSRRLRVHDERNEANEGDLVRVVETRPMSRTKRWRLAEILEKAK